MIRLVDLVGRYRRGMEVHACSTPRTVSGNPLITSNEDVRVSDKDNPIVVEDREDTDTICANNREDDTFNMELCREYNNNDEDVNVDIMECSNSVSTGLNVNSNHDDDTQSSTSFSDDVSMPETELNYSDFEVNSHYHLDDTPAIANAGFGEHFFLRKKLTDHWKSYIRPIKWRCTWLELQSKELSSRASRYEKELAQNSHEKQFELEKYTIDVGTKCMPFWRQSQRRNIMKRKRRTPVEDKIDISSHISNHNIFSYFENPKCFANGTVVDDKCSKREIPKYENKNRNNDCKDNEEWTGLCMTDDDDSLEDILLDIFELQKDVCNLKIRYKDMESKLPNRSAPVNIMSLLARCNDLDSFQDTFLEPFSEDTDDLLMPYDANTTYKELSVLMNVVESTDQPQVEATCLKTEETLIDNLVAVFSQDALGQSIAPNSVLEAEQPINASTEFTVKSFTIPKTRVPTKT